MVRVIELSSAKAQVFAADDWWRENRSAAADLFLNEYRDAAVLLSEAPEAAPHVTWGSVGTRRRRVLLLSRSGYHVYYRYFPRKKLVLVEAVWSAMRGDRPRLGGK